MYPIVEELPICAHLQAHILKDTFYRSPRIDLTFKILHACLWQIEIYFKWMLYPNKQADSRMQVFQFHMLVPNIMPAFENKQVKNLHVNVHFLEHMMTLMLG